MHQYALKYNDYQTKIIENLQNLRNNNEFVDVSICCEDTTFSAHKLILSANSSYFRKILKENPCNHPIIILKDISKRTLEDLLLFIYNGEVNLDTNNLEDFIKIAKLLKVEGLSEIEQQNLNCINTEQTEEITELKSEQNTDEIDEWKSDEQMTIDESVYDSVSTESSTNEDFTNFQQFLNSPGQNNLQIQANTHKQLVQRPSNHNISSKTCPVCNRNYSNLSNLKAHMTNVHNNSSKWISCRFCDKKLKTKHYLINHEMSAHGISQKSKRSAISGDSDADATDPNKI